MTDQVLLLANTAVAIVGIVLAIVWLKFPPVFALLFGTLYLGLTTKVGAAGTVEAVSGGFADVMGDIGILVALGVILGSLLTVTDTMQRLVEATLKLFGERSVPYVFAAALSSLFTSIYSDVLLVLSAPLARRLGPRLGPRGRAIMGGALTAGIEVGLVFVAPGVAAVAIAGILRVPLGQMFLLGLTVGLPTALLTMFAWAALLRVMKWTPELDELAVDDEPVEMGTPAHDDPSEQPGTGSATSRGPNREPINGQSGASRARTGMQQVMQEEDDVAGPRATRREPTLLVSITPVLVSLLLIAAGAAAEALSIKAATVTLLTDPVIALFIGAGLAYALASRVRPREEISAAVGTALSQCGPILVLSGISGSLGFIIEGSGMADKLSPPASCHRCCSSGSSRPCCTSHWDPSPSRASPRPASWRPSQETSTRL